MDRRTTARALAGISVLLLAGCERDDTLPAAQAERAPTTATGSSVAPAPAPAAGPAAMTARDACELLPAGEVASVAGASVQARREVVEHADQAICAYTTPDGASVLYVTAYWTGGRREWEARPLARVTGRALGGIGDAAYYGGFLPSAVLSGDVLLEFAMPLLPDEQTSFPILAQKALGRL